MGLLKTNFLFFSLTKKCIYFSQFSEKTSGKKLFSRRGGGKGFSRKFNPVTCVLFQIV